MLDDRPYPGVSLVIPVRNMSAELARCLGSINFAFPHWQTIVVDDASAEPAFAIASSYGVSEYVYCDPWRGVSQALNVGLRLATGSHFMALGADDYLEPDTLDQLYEAAMRTDADVVSPTLKTFGDAELTIEPKSFEPHDLLDANQIAAFSLVKTNLLRGVGGFNERFDLCEDWELWARLAAMGARFAQTPEAVVHYRSRADRPYNDEAVRVDYRDRIRALYAGALA